MTDRKLLELALDALLGVVNLAVKNICPHDETHRGGAIWEICNACGAKWADDEGGKPAYVEPITLTNAYQAIAALKEAIKQQGEPVAWIKPEWLNGSYRGALSPVTTYPQVDYVPLYTTTPTIPEGWQLVPIEPTKTQLRCGQLGITTTFAKAIYKAMLSVAPKYK